MAIGANNATLNGQSFVARIAAWQRTFSACKGPSLGLYHSNSIEFAAALIALWRLGKTAVIPANNLARTGEQLHTLCPQIAGEFNAHSLQASTANTGANLGALEAPAAATPALILFTSGSTGQPEPITKTFGQLEAELATLEQQWGSTLGHAIITSSVSHHHIYGLLFRLLWPLVTGRRFMAVTRNYWEELSEDTHQHQPLALITSPAHLSRIPPLHWPTPFVAVFSSGAALVPATAQAAQHTLGVAVTEIYGSTETGGIAWRQQTQSTSWAAFKGVQLQLNAQGLLEVKSPHLPSNAWWATADKAELINNQHFHLCGRADRIAKVAGKRISLSAIERELEAHPWVSEARVIMLQERGERLGAVIVLSNLGNKQLIDQGKLHLNAQLKTQLHTVIDRVAIPRYWRYLGELPRNSQGKTTLADLQTLFSEQTLPQLREEVLRQAGANSLTLTLFVPANLYYFDGHFPGRPVLPGVVQTHWAVHYAKAHWGDLGDFCALEAIKFQQVITANQTLNLALEYQPAKHKLTFSYTRGTAGTTIAHASGRVAFTPKISPQ